MIPRSPRGECRGGERSSTKHPGSEMVLADDFGFTTGEMVILGRVPGAALVTDMAGFMDLGEEPTE